MGNLKIMKYFSGVIFIGMKGIFILCLYVYLCIAHPICVRVCRWSGNLLSGSRWCFRWARSCI